MLKEKNYIERIKSWYVKSSRLVNRIVELLGNIKKIKISKIHIFIFFMGILTVICYSKAVYHTSNLNHFDNSITLYDSAGMTAEMAVEAKDNSDLDENPYSFTIWGETEIASISNKDLNRTSEVQRLEVCGRTDIIFPNEIPLEREDKSGCLIDKVTAMDLFGNIDIIGTNIQLGDKDYTVRGVMETDEQVFVTQIRSTEETKLDTITIRKIEDVPIDMITSELNLLYGFTGDVLAFQSIKGIIIVFLLIIPLFLGVFVLQLIWKYAKTARRSEVDFQENPFERYPLEFWFWCLSFGVILYVLLRLLFKQLSIPEDVLPTKWSDFNYWSDYWLKQQESFRTLIKIPKRIPEMDSIYSIIKAISYCVLSYLCFLITEVSMLLMRIKSKSQKIILKDKSIS